MRMYDEIRPWLLANGVSEAALPFVVPLNWLFPLSPPLHPSQPSFQSEETFRSSRIPAKRVLVRYDDLTLVTDDLETWIEGPGFVGQPLGETLIQSIRDDPALLAELDPDDGSRK